MAKYCRKLYMNCALPPLINATDPLTTDAAQGVGQLWVNSTNDSAWVNTDNTPGAAVWEALGGGGGSAYTPAVPADWGVTPTNAHTALNFIAAVDRLYYQNVLFVAPGLGDDTKNGYEFSPFATMQAAINKAMAGSGIDWYIFFSASLDEAVAFGTPTVSAKRLFIHGRDRTTTEWKKTGGGAIINATNASLVNPLSITLAHCFTALNNINAVATAQGAEINLKLLDVVLNDTSGNMTLTACKNVEFVDSIVNNDINITNIYRLAVVNSEVSAAGGSLPLVTSNGALIQHPLYLSQPGMIIDVSGRDADLAASSADYDRGAFTGFSAIMNVVNGGAPIALKITNEIVFGLIPITVPATCTLTMIGCKSMAAITASTGATLNTTQCRLQAVSNAGTWSDYGSTVASTSGDGTTTYNGTTIATVPTITTATRTQLRTDSALDFDATSNNIAYNLLSLASTPLDHKISLLRKPGGGANTVTITPNGAETIDGLASIALVEYQHTALVNKGTFWSAQ